MFYRCNILCTFIYFISTALVLGENQSCDKICIPFKHVFSIFKQLSSLRFLFVPGIVISPKSQGSYLGLNLKTLLEPHYYPLCGCECVLVLYVCVLLFPCLV